MNIDTQSTISYSYPTFATSGLISHSLLHRKLNFLFQYLIYVLCLYICFLEKYGCVCFACTYEIMNNNIVQNKEAYADQRILGAYFDEGRLARQMYTHPSWATIAQRAARNYRQLEKDSGKCSLMSRFLLFSVNCMPNYRKNIIADGYSSG